MPYKSVVLVKQVPDTKNITGEAMTPEGTINRAALPTVFNPEDLNALEMALQVRDREGGEVTVDHDGPALGGRDPARLPVPGRGPRDPAERPPLRRRRHPRDLLRPGLRHTRRSGGSTSSSPAARPSTGTRPRSGPRPPRSSASPRSPTPSPSWSSSGCSIVVRRALDQGTETGEMLPALPPHRRRERQRAEAGLGAQADRVQARRDEPRAQGPPRKWPAFGTEEALAAYLTERKLEIPVWSAADIGAEEDKLGLAGSPTQVHKINFVVLEGTESKEIQPTSEGIKALVDELVEEYIVG